MKPPKDIKTLIPLSDYLISYYDSHKGILTPYEYAKFLKQKPELWMFVPCDENNIPLPTGEGVPIAVEEEYKKALNKVIFKGSNSETRMDDTFYFDIEHCCFRYEKKLKKLFRCFSSKEIKTLEDLTNLNLELC